MKQNNPQYNELDSPEGWLRNPNKTPVYQIDKAIPLEEQQSYYILSQIASRRNYLLSLKQLNRIEALIYNKQMNVNWHRNMLVQLACTRQVEAYRIIEDFLLVAPKNLKNWAILAEFNARIALETILTDTKSVTVVSSGLGGRDNMMRFSSGCTLLDSKHFEEYQKELAIKEFSYAISENGGKLENCSFGDSCLLLTYLMPIGLHPDGILHETISICNEFGAFLNENNLKTTNLRLLQECDFRHPTESPVQIEEKL